MPGLMTQQLHAGSPGAAFHVIHLPVFEPFQPGMRQKKRDRDSSRVVRGEPLARQPARRAQPQPVSLQLFIKPLNECSQIGLFHPETQIAKTYVHQLLFGKRRPEGFPARLGFTFAVWHQSDSARKIISARVATSPDYFGKDVIISWP